jgi:murein L,D-transpeptidase YcbB/YkuD
MLYIKQKKDAPSIKSWIALIIITLFVASNCLQPSNSIVITTDDPMAKQFYDANDQYLFWFSSNRNIKKAKEWMVQIDSANQYGIVSDQLQVDQVSRVLSNKNWIEDVEEEKTDQQLTVLILNFIKELQEGNIHFDYDEVKVSRDSIYVDQLLNANPKELVSKMVARLDCKDQEYRVLKNYLNDSITKRDTLKYKSVIRAMNYRRYISVNEQPEYVLVNIPEAVAKYYNDNRLSMKMRAVLGKKRTPTPTIASHLTTIVTFPHWNVPRSIATKEILPKVQKDEIYLEQNNLAVVNAKGNEVEESELNWMDYTEKNFPYFFRQSTGARNALGVLKFDFQNPYSIYMHSTNSQSGFLKEKRFLSHGCIRLEKPIDLAKSLLRGKLNINELKTGKKDTESEKIELQQKVPVFIIYSPVSVEGNNVTFLPDVYGLIK